MNCQADKKISKEATKTEGISEDGKAPDLFITTEAPKLLEKVLSSLEKDKWKKAMKTEFDASTKN